jgi:N-acetylneuraminic acid mutarotase
MAVGRLNNRAQLIGGEIRADGGAFSRNEEYDPATNSWRALRAIPTGRHGAVAGTVGDSIYVIGGGDTGGSAFTAINEVFAFEK